MRRLREENVKQPGARTNEAATSRGGEAEFGFVADFGQCSQYVTVYGDNLTHGHSLYLVVGRFAGIKTRGYEYSASGREPDVERASIPYRSARHQVEFDDEEAREADTFNSAAVRRGCWRGDAPQEPLSEKRRKQFSELERWD